MFGTPLSSAEDTLRLADSDLATTFSLFLLFGGAYLAGHEIMESRARREGA
jgi:hypothetical protein